ncbi:MAG: LptF/LptG family permease [Candidatus Omnitrophota bacterium]
MRILDKYIIKNVSLGYLFVLLVFVGLYFIADIFTNLSDILKAKTPIDTLGQYYLSSLPLIILRVSPLSLLISTLYTFGELNRNNEIISIRASGVSIIRIAMPVILFSLLLSVSTFFLQEKTLMTSQRKVDEIKTQFIKNSVSTAGEERNLAFTSGDRIFFVQKFYPKKGILDNVIIFKEGESRQLEKKIVCKEIAYEYGFWIAKNLIEYDLDSKGDIIGNPTSFKTKKIGLKEKPRELLLKRSIFSQFSSLSNLKKEISRLKKVKADKLLASLTIDYHQKIAEPFSHLFLVIGILPLALEIKKRKVALSSLGTGFIFSFIYYILSSFSVALGKSGILLPFLSVSLAPLFFLTVGISGLILIR